MEEVEGVEGEDGAAKGEVFSGRLEGGAKARELGPGRLG